MIIHYLFLENRDSLIFEWFAELHHLNIGHFNTVIIRVVTLWTAGRTCARSGLIVRGAMMRSALSPTSSPISPVHSYSKIQINSLT